jgi:hypothetical protein
MSTRWDNQGLVEVNRTKRRISLQFINPLLFAGRFMISFYCVGEMYLKKRRFI